MTSLQRASGDNVHTIIRSTRVVTPDGVRPASVHIAGDRIARVSEHDDFHGDARLIDAQGDYVMPGLVDTHVHVNEPGRTEWEGYASATRAAAAGGVTTIFDMPLNSIPATTTIAALEMKRASAQMNAVVNVGFIGGVVPGNAPDLALLSSAGAVLFKCFLVPSGVDEFPCVSEADLRQAMPVLTQCNATLMVHAELPDHINPVPSGDARAYSNYLSTRPELAETSAVDLMVRLSSEFGTRVHIVHVSSAQTVRSLRDARARGVSITAETCPHYLTFQSDRIADGRTEFKCAPPIRDAVCREELWTAVKAGELEAIVSDHSPCPPSMKQRSTGNFMEAWGGIASLQLGLSAVWAGARERGMRIETVVERMSTAPAALAHLGTRKGRLEAGYDADITVFDADASGALSDSALYHKHSLTPYDDTVLAGRVRATYVNGIETFRDGQITNINAGRLIGGEQGTT